MKKLIIIPAYNESESIVKTVASLEDARDKYDYIVINDGSTDSTPDLLKEHNLRHINLLSNLGIGGAMQTGYKYACENDYDIAIQYDGDGQHSAECLDKLCEPVVTGAADMSIGSRYINKEGFQSSTMRRVGIKYLSSLIKTICGKRVTDPTSGFRACSKKAIRHFAKHYPYDYPEPETVVELMHLGYSITEVPVVMKERDGGQSSIARFKAPYYMIKVSISMLYACWKKSEGGV